MNAFKYIFWTLYRIWFYTLVILLLLILFPFFFITILKESWYPIFFKFARLWAKIILIGMGFRVKIERLQKLEKHKSYMLIANHTSMTDIMLMLVSVKNPFVFVGKAELAKFPVFGFFYKRACILVDRSSLKSRQGVFLRAQKRLKSGLSICIFPEGGVPEEYIELDDFKDGAFKLAITHQIPIVPLVFPDTKKRFSFTFFSGGPGKMRVKMLGFLYTTDLTLKDTKVLKEKSRAIILGQLRAFKKPLLSRKRN